MSALAGRAPLLALLLVALLVRLALIPLAAGSDFRAFAHLAALALHGRDVYALSRAQLHTAPWTYFPLCLDLFALLQGLALHLGWPFRLVGKLPIVLADLAVGGLLYGALRRRGQTGRRAAGGTALYLFNPLVLYNGAFYGRFDAVALAFLLLALERYRTRWFAPAYALAIAAKTFPLFLLPLLALGRARQRPRGLLLAGVGVALLALPALLTDPRGLLHALIYHASGGPGGRLSWYLLPLREHWLSAAQTAAVAQGGLVLYPAALLLVAHRPLYVKAAVGLTLFVALDPTVYEQYLLWALPFLIVVGLCERSRLALVVVGLFTVAGMLENEQTWGPHTYLRGVPLPTPWPPLNALLALVILLFLAAQATAGPGRPALAPASAAPWARGRGMPRTAVVPLLYGALAALLYGALAALLYGALAALLCRRAWAAPSALALGATSDPPQFMWFLAWVPFALTHAHDPLVSSYVDYPGGVNLMWNTSILLPAAALAPVTARYGPVVAYNLLITLAPALSAWCAYLALRRFVRGPLAAAAGGLLYGFSPYLLTEALAHPQLALALAPPLALLLGHELLVRRRWPAPVAGGALGLLAAAQLLTGEELLATTTLVALLALAALPLVRGVRRADRAAARRARRGGLAAAAAAVFALLAAAPLTTQVAGPQRVHGPLHADPATVYVTDLLGPLVPSARQWLAPPTPLPPGARLRIPPAERTGYLGLPLLLLLAVTVARGWRRPAVRWAGLLALAVALLALGPRLEVAGHVTPVTPVPLPWALLGQLPALRYALPSRLMVFVDLLAALLLALFLDQGRARAPAVRWAGRAAGALALLPLLPQPTYPVAAVPVPTFFGGAALSRLPPGRVALVAPFAAPYHSRSDAGPYSRAMLWQAVARMRFRMPEGYAFAPQADGAAALHPPTSALQTAMVAIQRGAAAPPLTARQRRALTGDLRAWQASAIIVGPMGNRPAMLLLFRRLLGRAPVAVGGVSVWWRVGA